MAYLRWSSSPWYAYSHIDGGDGDAALLLAWHERGARLAVTAGELVRAGCGPSPAPLRALLERSAGIDAAALQDVALLAPAVAQFLFEIQYAGKIAMPAEVAQRWRELRRAIEDAFARPVDAHAAACEIDSDGTPTLLRRIAEFGAINRCYPPPRPSREIRDLIQSRALRAMAGERVSPAQEAKERERIARATEWPPR